MFVLVQRTVHSVNEFIECCVPNTEKVVDKKQMALFFGKQSKETLQFISTYILNLPKALLIALNSAKWKLNILN